MSALPRHSNSAWESNRQRIAAGNRQFSSQLSKISRLFQRVIMNGAQKDFEDLKHVLDSTEKQLLEILRRIDSR